MIRYPSYRVNLTMHSLGKLYRLRSHRVVQVVEVCFGLGNSLEVVLKDVRNATVYNACYLPNGAQASIVRSQDMVEQL